MSHHHVILKWKGGSNHPGVTSLIKKGFFIKSIFILDESSQFTAMLLFLSAELCFMLLLSSPAAQKGQLHNSARYYHTILSEGLDITFYDKNYMIARNNLN